MDILCSPENASQVEETRYLCDAGDRWDGGPFVTFPQRAAILHMVPPSFRQYNLDVPYTELIHPSNLNARQSIYTTWLFIGLISEFLSSNRQEDPDRPPDNPDAEEVIASIYKHCVITKDSGERFLSGEPIKDLVLAIVALINKSTDVEARLNYLSSCLRVASGVLTSPATPGVDRSLKFAIAGLGELLSVIVRHGVALKDFGDVSLPLTGFNWKHDFLLHDSSVQQRMISAGWCKSDLSRADSLYQHLFTMHYLSLLHRHVPGRDHSNCTGTICAAAQIDNDTYKLSHATEGCTCEEFRVDIGKIKDVLGKTETYPVLVFDPDDETALLVKPFLEGDEYIALSHVWADGLGNTKDNTLQKCQIARLRRLVAAVEDEVWAKDTSQPRPKYHIWVDTLCCPVAKLEPYYNKISLLRMKTVYEQATHVLVLDLALSMHNAEELRPATLLLRIFGSSIWMRRLWTLQEGVLAKSMYFQFRDKPVHAQSMLPKLLAPDDFRYWVMWGDLHGELRRLMHLSIHPLAIKNPTTEKHPLYRSIQDALDFRAVSYPSDEPICIATLLGLDLSQILSSSPTPSNPQNSEPPTDAQITESRMCTLWTLLAAADNGIPSRLIFIVDTPLSTPGFGWAPRTLLGAGENRGRQGQLLEFTEWNDSARGVAKKARTPSGVITKYGLGVDFPGWVLRVETLGQGLPLHAWEGVLKVQPSEDFVFVFLGGKGGGWFRIADWHATAGPASAITRGLVEGEVDAARPVCSAVDCGRMALIRGEGIDPHNAMLWLLAEVLEEGATPEGQTTPGYRVRWVRKVMISQVHGLDLLVLEASWRIAKEVAASDETAEFVRVKEAFGGDSEEFAAAKEKVRQKLKDVTTDAWNNVEGFAMAVERTIGEGMEEYIWASIPMRFSHKIEGVVTAEDQRWYVD